MSFYWNNVYLYGAGQQTDHPVTYHLDNGSKGKIKSIQFDMKGRLFIIIALLIFWAGFVSSISFMEAWLKFRAEGVTLNIGLSIGKKIFTALNRTEWVFLSLYSLLGFYQTKIRLETRTLASLLLILILFAQTFFVLPPLNNRVDILLAGETPGKSLLHVYFGSLEILKVGILILLGFQWYKFSILTEVKTG